MSWFYAVGFLFGCEQNFRRYVAAALSDEQLERQLEEWTAV
jgi:hypothetical protein